MPALYLLIGLAVLAVIGLLLRSRSGHDPASSVDNFSRALQAMQPMGGPGAKSPAKSAPEPTDGDPEERPSMPSVRPTSGPNARIPTPPSDLTP